MQSLREYFEQQSHNPHSITDYFLGVQRNLLIEIDEADHQINLSFVHPPKWRHFNPIKELHLFESVISIKPFHQTEFAFKFGRVLDVKAVAWAIANAYRKLGYRCAIAVDGELYKVEELQQTSTAA
jgi:hypothetical protein